MKKGLTLLVFVMDRSGSMASIITDSIGGFNTLIEQQKADCLEKGNTAKVTIVKFNSSVESICNYEDISKVTPLTGNTFYASGGTSLIDAVCATIVNTGHTLSELSEEERPEKVLFTIITDGEENTSREYTLEKLKEMISEQEKKYNWTFSFIGANIDSFGTANNIGFSNSRGVANYQANSRGVKAMFRGVSNYTMNLKNSAVGDTSFMSVEAEISAEEKK